jgi:hypothetical protein
MIPLFAVVGFRRPGRRGFHLWLPLLLVWLLLLPLILVLLPIVIAILALARAKPLRVLATLWSFLAALRGTHIEIDSRDAAVLIRII